MSYTRQSLLEYLKTKDPRLFVAQPSGQSKSNSRSGRSAWAKPSSIVEWDDFDFDTLSLIYGGALRESLKRNFNLEKFHIPEKPFCHITGESSVTSLVVKWNQSMVSRALYAAQDGADECLSRKKVDMCNGDQAKYPGGNSRYRPDWAGVRTRSTEWNATLPKPDIILPGDSKPSRKWSSAQVKRGKLKITKQTAQVYLPLEQVYTYCIAANARYGYLITDSELVVLRLRPNNVTEGPRSRKKSRNMESVEDDNPRPEGRGNKPNNQEPASRTKRDGILEIKSIPWQDDTNEQSRDASSLTINLALWWLHIMAANKHEIEDTYPSLHTEAWNTELKPEDIDLAQLTMLDIGSSHGKRKRGERADSKGGNSEENGDPHYQNPSSPNKRQTRSSTKAARNAA